MDYIEKNHTEYLRMKNFLENLNEDSWRKSINETWNINSILWHLAFWDTMTYERLFRWKTLGFMSSVPPHDNIDAINATFRSISDLLDLETSKLQILQAAEKIDNLVAGFSEDDIDFLQDTGKERWYRRHVHRSEHLNRILE